MKYTQTQLDIVGYLLNQEEPQTIRGIARALKKSYPLVYNNLEDLRKKEIISKKSAPPAKIISLNPHAPVNIFIEAEKKTGDTFLKKHKWIDVFLDNVLADTGTVYFSLLIFGGYAKGKETPKSDIDILVIVPKKDDINLMEKIIKSTYLKVKKHLVIVDEEDFISMITKANQFNVGNEAKKHHLILYGVEGYYQLMRKAMK